MTPDIMHLAANISDLLLSLWRGNITCMPTDNIDSWDWAVFCDEQIWQDHGCAVEKAGIHLLGLFDTKPCNITAKINMDYKTWEFLIYTFALAPGLLENILPNPYWRNLCKLIRRFQITFPTQGDARRSPSVVNPFCMG